MVTQDHRARVKIDGVEYYLGKCKTPAQAREKELEFRAQRGLTEERRQAARSAAARRGWAYRRQVGT